MGEWLALLPNSKNFQTVWEHVAKYYKMVQMQRTYLPPGTINKLNEIQVKGKKSHIHVTVCPRIADLEPAKLAN